MVKKTEHRPPLPPSHGPCILASFTSAFDCDCPISEQKRHIWTYMQRSVFLLQPKVCSLWFTKCYMPNEMGSIEPVTKINFAKHSVQCPVSRHYSCSLQGACMIFVIFLANTRRGLEFCNKNCIVTKQRNLILGIYRVCAAIWEGVFGNWYGVLVPVEFPQQQGVLQ